MGSVGNGNKQSTALPDDFNGLFGERKSVNVFERLDNITENGTINPFYNVSSLYKRNCAICATATALQMRGYDVEAGPRDENNWRGFNSVFDVDYVDTNNYILPNYGGVGTYRYSGMPSESEVKNNIRASLGDDSKVQKMPKGAGPATKAIENKVKSWGDGSYGVLSVRWKDYNSAHVVNVFNRNGQIVIYDGQINKTFTGTQALTSYMKRTIAGRTALVRLDNAPIRSDYSSDTMKKMFNKSGKKWGD